MSKRPSIRELMEGKCPLCGEHPSELPGGSCLQCAFDAQLDCLIMGAAIRSNTLGIKPERFLELCHAAVDVAVGT
jgi:hypothetical protein